MAQINDRRETVGGFEMRGMGIGLVAVMLATPAIGATVGTWHLSADSTRVVTGLSPGQWATWDPTATGDDSPIIGLGNCENVDWYNFANSNGDATVGTVPFHFVQCPGDATDLTTDGIRDLACAPIEGTAAVAADRGINGAPGLPFARVEGDGTGANPAEHRIMVKCSQPSNR